MRAVFDTNVMISGIVHAGKSKQLIDAVLDGKIALLLSSPIVQEFSEVIARDKFKLSKEQQSTTTSFLLRISRIVKTKSRFKVIKEDPADDKILRTAYDGEADCIVSGDEHLLSLREFEGIRILSVKEMLELIKDA